MHVIIKEKNGFMPDTIISIYEDRVEVEEYKEVRILNYDKYKAKEILKLFLEICGDWKEKYIQKSILDNDVFTINIVSKKNKEIYIKNKYPENWDKFILFRNKLIREEL